MWFLVFRVECFELRVSDLEFRVWGLRLWESIRDLEVSDALGPSCQHLLPRLGSGLRVWGLVFKASGFGFRVSGFGLRVEGLGLRVSR